MVDALERRAEIGARLRGRRLALFLDYDGTLTPIVSRPELGVLSRETREVLRRLARKATVAIVSGRSLADVRGLVGLEELAYAGNHGFEIRGPEGRDLSHEVGKEFRDDLEGALDAVSAGLAKIPGAWVEDKTQSLSVHYRQTPKERQADVEAAVDRALEGRPRLRKHNGKMVFEVRPRVEWDKGRAVLWLLEALALEGPDTLAMYVGDDVTDEDAFRALAGRGLGVLVADPPRPSAASYRLRGADEVRRFLEGLAELLEEGTA